MTNDPKAPENIERDIELKRAKVAADLTQLRSSLSLGALAQSAGKLGLRYAGKLGGATLSQTQKNPLPMATIAAGFVWLFVANSKSHVDVSEKNEQQPTPKPAPDVAPSPETPNEAKATDTTPAAKTDAARELVADHPFVVGALVLAAGAALGHILPRTKAEDDLMSSTQDLLHAEKQRLSRIAQTLKQEAEGIFAETKADLDSGAPAGQSAVEAVGDIAKDAADRIMAAAAKDGSA
jgi:hypothetical protein